MNQIKVLYLSHQTGFGGGEVALLRLLEGNDAVEPIIFTPESELAKRSQERGYKTYISKGLAPLRRKQNKFWMLKLPIRLTISFWELLRICIKEKPAIIHANSIATGLYSWLVVTILRIPIVCHIHAPAILEQDFGGWDIKAARFLTGKVFIFVTVSETMKEALVNEGIPKKKIKVVYNGIDYKQKFSPKKYKDPSVLREEYEIEGKMIGMVGSITERKGFHVFLKAAHRVVEESGEEGINFFIVGEAGQGESKKYEKKLKNFVQDKNLEDSVYFTGFRKDIPAVLKDFDILVHASIKPETLGMVILEGLAMEKCIIASDSGGPTEIIESGQNGLLYEAGDVNELVENINWCLGNFEKAKQLGKEGRKTVKEKFGVETQKTELLSLYQKAIE